jgi:hypothetical protein
MEQYRFTDTNFTDDMQLDDMRKRLREMKEERKKAEATTQQMNIHLSSLKREKNANWSTINKTKQLTTKKLKHFDNYLNSRELLAQIKQEKEDNILKQREQNKILRDSLRNSQKMQMYYKDKYEKFQLQKLQNDYNKELSIYLKNVERENNRKKVNEVKKQVYTFQENKQKKIMELRKKEKEKLEQQLMDEYLKLKQLEMQQLQIQNEGYQIQRDINESNKIKNDYLNKLDKITTIRNNYDVNNNVNDNISNDNYIGVNNFTNYYN